MAHRPGGPGGGAVKGRWSRRGRGRDAEIARAAATVNRRLAALRRFFGWAQPTGRVRELPTAGVVLPLDTVGNSAPVLILC